MKSFKSLFVLITAVLFCSCSIQKRHYMKGYNLSNKNFAVDDKRSEDKEISFTNYSASIDEEVPSLVIEKTPVFEDNTTSELQIDSCVSTKADKNISEKHQLQDSLFMKRSHDIIIVHQSHKDARRGLKPIRNGYVTEISRDTIKYIPVDAVTPLEIVVKKRNVVRIITSDGETFSNYELKKIKNKISSNEVIRKYAQSIERKEPLLKELLLKSLIFDIISMLFPIIGIFFACRSLRLLFYSNKILKTSPELKKKYNTKYIFLTILSILGIVGFGGLIIVFLGSQLMYMS